MRTLTLPRHYWVSFHRPAPKAVETLSQAPVHDTKPRAPANLDELFWAASKVRLFGIVLPNRYQATFFAALCIILALPVFLFDTTGHAIYHGTITLVSLAAFAAFCWVVGMLLATVSDTPKDRSDHR